MFTILELTRTHLLERKLIGWKNLFLVNHAVKDILTTTAQFELSWTKLASHTAGAAWFWLRDSAGAVDLAGVEPAAMALARGAGGIGAGEG
ncbi:hypothetical protein [Tuwongella immobilis]|uniref:hypothetical protein n=1 Tax=Tuwongella immobilis TaxID=692036 RepID=UPI0013A6916C|nr:hypothetical protein [Tuwongella immobilis]